MIEYYQQLYKLLQNNTFTRYTCLNGYDIGDESIYLGEKEVLSLHTSVDKDNPWTLREDLATKPHLVIYGGGHVSKALYDLAILQRMPITIFDDREEFADRERFPQADVILAPYESIVTKPISFPGAYHVIVTRGHQYDELCLAYALRQSHHYIGMIGSKGKVALTYASLKTHGFTDKDLSQVHSPIGLSIGGDSPEEIAISIMAEIISCYSKGKKRIMIDPQTVKILSTLDGRGTLVRVIGKSGSSPARQGAMLLVTEDHLFGTIGGGELEHQAIAHARMSLRNEIIEYDLSTGGDLGMACGGKTRLLYTIV